MAAPDTVSHIVLLLPGLDGPDSEYPIADYFEQRPLVLDRLLSRSKSVPVDGYDCEAVLMDYFGLDVSQAAAPLTFLADTGRAPSGYVMRADPVHLRADQSCLRLFEPHSFSITQDEANALADAFNAFYIDQGWQLLTTHPERWYLELPDSVEMTTTSPLKVAGSDINPHLPLGKDARSWHAVMNEVQMLFHTHEVNLVREQKGQPTVNSLWFWGGGTMPVAGQSKVDQAFSDMPLAQGLVEIAGLSRQGVPEDVSQFLRDVPAGVTLLILDKLMWPAQYDDINEWSRALQRLDKELFAPLLLALNDRTIASLTLVPCNGAGFYCSRKGQHAFWRRIRNFEQVMRQ